jgi:hypothetical protein
MSFPMNRSVTYCPTDILSLQVFTDQYYKS